MPKLSLTLPLSSILPIAEVITDVVARGSYVISSTTPKQTASDPTKSALTTLDSTTAKLTAYEPTYFELKITEPIITHVWRMQISWFRCRLRDRTFCWLPIRKTIYRWKSSDQIFWI